MNRRQFIQTASSLVAAAGLRRLHAQGANAESTEEWMDGFKNPPDSAYPWAYSFWLDGNVTKEGISSDLEAMKEAGIQGLLFMDGSVGNPVGPHRFMSPSWLEMFHHMLAEADRLEMEVNLNNDPGWAGSGGPWIKPEQASQKVIAVTVLLQGPSSFDTTLPTPPAISHDFYQDIAVIAYPAPSDGNLPAYRIPGFDSTKSFGGGEDFFGVVPWPRFIPTSPEWPAVPASQSLSSSKLQDLTNKVEPTGRLVWDIPPGRWIIFRFGHTVGNGGTRSVQEEAKGLECDKLSKSALDSHFASMVGKLTELAGPLNGKVIVSTHIDSWEAGSGNWTNGFREQFGQRRGYDLLPFLPTLEGIVVDSREVSERFLWDYRETVCELLLENYAGHFRELAHSKGLRLSIEAYDGTCDDLRYAGRADEPMTEFWKSCYSGLPLSDLSESMASAAHVYGKPIIGAEAFTSGRGDFLDHPATLKPLADWAFCTGVNRLCFSEWIIQPWTHLVPGISFSLFGTVFHQSLTWWGQSKPWHQYIARCQYMLRQGNFVADVCFVAPEGGPYRFTPPVPGTIRGVVPDRPGYNFDGCPPELVLKEMTVEDGLVALPSGMKYRLLVLPSYNAEGQTVIRLMDQVDYFYKPMSMPIVRTMTPELLQRIKELAEGGATVLGNRPVKSPSLTNFPECDDKVSELADEIWGRDAGAAGVGEHRIGKGRVVWGSTPEQILARMGVPADFECTGNLKGKFNYTHRRTADGSDIYFVVNQEAAFLQGLCCFRVIGKHSELYWPQTGIIEPLTAFEEKDGVTSLLLSLNPNESVFVAFRALGEMPDRILSITYNGERLWPKWHSEEEVGDLDDSFTMAVWVRPGPNLPLPEANGDSWVYKQGDVQVPGLGYQTYSAPGQGRGGFSVGRNGIVVFLYGESGEVEPLLVYEAPITAPLQVGMVYKNRIPKLFVNGRLVKTGPEKRLSYGSSGWADRRPFAGENATLAEFDAMLTSAGLESTVGTWLAGDQIPAIDFAHSTVWRSGSYAFKSTKGESMSFNVHLPPPQGITGPWEVEFDPRWGGPSKITFSTLDDWSTRPEEGIRYYSGPATYRTTFELDRTLSQNPNSRIYLDLGKVAVIAEVTLNQQNLGIVWNAPYRIDVTDAIHRGENKLETKVVNVWVNRLIGDEQLPEDGDYSPEGQLKRWPQWVLKGKTSPTGRFTFTTYRQWVKDSPLVESGLLGPVRLLSAEKIATTAMQRSKSARL